MPSSTHRIHAEIVRFPMAGRDVVLFALIGSEPTKITSLPIPSPHAWTEPWRARGVLELEPQRGWRVRVRSREFASACRKLVDEFPRFDRMCRGPTEIEVMASLPHTYGGAALRTGLPHQVVRGFAIRSLVRKGWVSASSRGGSQFTAPPSVRAFVKAYRRLYCDLPSGIEDPSAVCIYQHGVEAAWTLARDGGRAVAYSGLRKLHPVDAMLLNWRMKANLEAGCRLTRAELLEPEVEEASRLLTLHVVGSKIFRDRLEFYGLDVLQKPLQVAIDAARNTRCAWTLKDWKDWNGTATYQEQKRALRWVDEA